MRRTFLALPLIAAATLVAAVPAAAAPTVGDDASWSGQYSLKRFAATKTGTSLAARQGEPDFADTYTFASTCADSTCTSVVTDGPKPANETLPQPATYTWDGTSWVHTYDWMWDCYQGEGNAKVYTPAHSLAYYTPRADGTFDGVWTTTIDADPSGGPSPCEGTVVMNIAAYPVVPIPPVAPAPFGS